MYLEIGEELFWEFKRLGCEVKFKIFNKSSMQKFWKQKFSELFWKACSVDDCLNFTKIFASSEIYNRVVWIVKINNNYNLIQ